MGAERVAAQSKCLLKYIKSHISSTPDYKTRRMTWNSLMTHNLKQLHRHWLSYHLAAPLHNSFKSILTLPLMNFYKTKLSKKT